MPGTEYCHPERSRGTLTKSYGVQLARFPQQLLTFNQSLATAPLQQILRPVVLTVRENQVSGVRQHRVNRLLAGEDRLPEAGVACGPRCVQRVSDERRSICCCDVTGVRNQAGAPGYQPVRGGRAGLILRLVRCSSITPTKSPPGRVRCRRGFCPGPPG